MISNAEDVEDRLEGVCCPWITLTFVLEVQRTDGGQTKRKAGTEGKWM